MVGRTLRREQLGLFFSQDIETSANFVQSKVGLLDYYYKTLNQLRAGFDKLGTTLTTIFGSGTTVRAMSDLKYFIYYKRFLNPSLADRFEVDFDSLFREELSIQELCWDSDGVGASDKAGFYLDGHSTPFSRSSDGRRRLIPASLAARKDGAWFHLHQATKLGTTSIFSISTNIETPSSEP